MDLLIKGFLVFEKPLVGAFKGTIWIDNFESFSKVFIDHKNILSLTWKYYHNYIYPSVQILNC